MRIVTLIMVLFATAAIAGESLIAYERATGKIIRVFDSTATVTPTSVSQTGQSMKGIKWAVIGIAKTTNSVVAIPEDPKVAAAANSNTNVLTDIRTVDPNADAAALSKAKSDYAAALTDAAKLKAIADYIGISK